MFQTVSSFIVIDFIDYICSFINTRFKFLHQISVYTFLVIYIYNNDFFLLFQMWELLILSKLKWDVLTVTPHDFVRPLLRRIPVHETDVDSQVLFRHINTFIALCARGKFFYNLLCLRTV